MSGPLAEFLQFLEEGRFMLQRRTDTGEFLFYPRHPVGSGGWEWAEASGKGTIYSITRIRQKPERGGDFYVALVELQEGPRIMSRIVDAEPGTLAIGQAVEVVVDRPSWACDGPAISFRPACRVAR